MSQNLSDQQFAQAAIALRLAKKNAGGVTALARAAGVSTSAASAWTICPPKHLNAVSDAGGVDRAELRPDIFGGVS